LKAFSDTDPLVIYEFHSVEWVFRQMTKDKKHMAIVLDEYGGTEGIITHEDVIEAMIGSEIEDETDLEKEGLVEKLTDTEIICDGKITLYRLNSVFDTEIPEEEDVLAGYLLKELNDFPEEGEVIERNNLTYKILKVEGRTIKKVKIIK
jgi:putative hemolysin